MKLVNFLKQLLTDLLIVWVDIRHNVMVDLPGMVCGWILIQWMMTTGGLN